MGKTVRVSLFLFFLAARLISGETLVPVSVRKLDGGVVTGVAWLDSTHIIVAGAGGVRTLSLDDGKWSDLIPSRPVPDGLPYPLSVVTDGQSVVVSNGFERSQFACQARSGRRIFARSSPSPMVIDLAVSGDKLYILAWPVDRTGPNNPDGIAVWRGGVTYRFETFEPLHRITSGAESVAIFNDSLPIFGGALAVEKDGTLDVITAAEAGIFQYSRAGVLRRRLGAKLGELVMRRMHDINFTYGMNDTGRYREVVNRQPTIDDLIVTPDGPAILVRIAKDELIEWELWYPNDERIDRRVKLGISRRGPFGHLACDARDWHLACVYQSPATREAAIKPDQSDVPTSLVQFKLTPRRGRAEGRAANGK